jgi:hypothetical protein
MNGWLVHSGPGNKWDQLYKRIVTTMWATTEQNYRWSFLCHWLTQVGPLRNPQKWANPKLNRQVTSTQVPQFMAVSRGTPCAFNRSTLNGIAWWTRTWTWTPLGNFQNLKLEHSNQWVGCSTVWQKLIEHKLCNSLKRTPKRTPPTYRHPIIIIIIWKKGFFVPLN